MSVNNMRKNILNRLLKIGLYTLAGAVGATAVAASVYELRPKSDQYVKIEAQTNATGDFRGVDVSNLVDEVSADVARELSPTLQGMDFRENELPWYIATGTVLAAGAGTLATRKR